MSVPGHRKITEPHQNDWDMFFKGRLEGDANTHAEPRFEVRILWRAV
jgi:hypothetical protein